ncbi:Gfo/Idh/MocA family protein [Marivivens aquimaris]|uniref:Gfo/Idh/MocA family protein n=1 Tax=Marivivens aquimaris TaxID=2774876 RepID=UPI001882464B|nr:Gfo/Idh/MocA family oxidoreductase [Marivivens aquimaris]
MRIKVIGAGSIGRRHHDNLISLGIDSTLVPWREYSPAVMDDADAAVIATATDVRVGPIGDAAERNLPMYIEKPVAFRPEDLVRIEHMTRDVAEKSVVGLMMRYHPAFRLLADQDVSDAVRFSLDIGHDVTQWRQNWLFSESYAAKPNGGGVLLDLCHEIDMGTVLFPGLALEGVYSLGHDSYPEVDMSSRLTLVSPKGAAGSVGMDYLTPKLHRRTVVYGFERMYDFDFAAQHYVITDENGPRTVGREMERNEMFVGITGDWLRILRGEEPENRLVPRLDRVSESTALTATAWAARQFYGTIEKEIP